MELEYVSSRAETEESRDEEVGVKIRRSDMSELSEYFEKDARRYDRGFEH